MLYDIWRDIEDLDFMKPVFLWQQEHDEHFPQYETTTPHMCHKLTYAKNIYRYRYIEYFKSPYVAYELNTLGSKTNGRIILEHKSITTEKN